MMADKTWKPSKKKYGVAICNFEGKGEGTLALHVGEAVHILEEYGSGTSAWYRGTLLRNTDEMGIFPACCIHIKPCEVSNEGLYETITPIEDIMAKEVTYVLREWAVIWKDLFLTHKRNLFDSITQSMTELITLRGLLVYKKLSQEEAYEVKRDIVAVIDWGNGQMGMDLVPRIDGEQVDADLCSITQLHRVHVDSAHTAGEGKPRRRRQTTKISKSDLSVDGINTHHILASFKNFGCNVGDTSETLLSLYHLKDNKCFCITEKFVVKHNKMSMPEDRERLHSYYGLFTDLTVEDLEKDLYLVAQIFRIGRMNQENTKKPPSVVFKRPWGVGVVNLNLNHLPSNFNEWEFQMKVSVVEAENEFSTLHEKVIRRMAQGTSHPLAGSIAKQGLSLSIAIKVLNGDLATVKKEDPMLFSKGVAIVQKLGFSEVITPGEVRNDLYVTLKSAEFDRGSKKAQKNVEVKVTVYDANLNQIRNCITYGCGESPDSEYLTAVYYHNNKPEWDETIKISVPIDMFPGSHICFELFHCSVKKKEVKKPYGFAFVRLTNDAQIVIKDADHELIVYHLNEKSKLDIKKYIALPFLIDDLNDPQLSNKIPSNLQFPANSRESLVIKTLLCSGKFTSNSDLLGILNWRGPQFKDKLSENLDKLTKMQGDELVKFLHDILDALFDMFNEELETKMLSGKIFKSLVNVFTLIHHARFETFKPILESYITETFSSPLIHKLLCRCFCDMISSVTQASQKTNTNMHLIQVFQSVDYIFRFIVRSRELQKKSVYSRSSGDDREFQENIRSLFESMGVLMSSTSGNLQAYQVALLNSLHMSYPPLLTLLPERELSELLEVCINNMPPMSDLPEDVTRFKLELLRKTVNTSLFTNDASRSILLPICLTEVKNSLAGKVLVKPTVELLGDMLDSIFKLKQKSVVSEDIQKIVSSLFDVIVDVILDVRPSKPLSATQDPCEKKVKKRREAARSISQNISSKYLMQPKHVKRSPTNVINLINLKKIPTISINAATIEPPHEQGVLIACLTEILRLMEEEHYTALLHVYHRGPPLRGFLDSILQVFHMLVQPKVFPKDWTVMRMVTNNVVFTAIEYFSQALKDNYITGDKFDEELWRRYFNLAVAFIVQPSLQLGNYSVAKAQKMKERYQDMRVLMGVQVETLWQSLGHHKEIFIPSMIGPFLEITLVPEREVRKATLPIIYDMIESEQRIAGNFKQVGATLIERLDYFLTQQFDGDTEYKELFQKILLERVQSEPSLTENGPQFIISVTHLLERLLDYRQVFDGEENRDKRMHCTFNILNFYKDEINREEMYIRYVNKLHELHQVAGNYTEAGKTLELYANILNWSQNYLKKEMRYKEEMECDRKEMLYREIISCFDKGKVWEYAIPLCKDLAKFYEGKLDYKKLGDILKQQASFYQKILEGEDRGQSGAFYPRQDPSYYRVAYYGQSFPSFVRNKQFIYRGDECLKLETIIHHLTAEFPAAQIIPNNHTQNDAIKDGDQQYIQICNVKPIPQERPEFQGMEVPTEIKNFYNANEVDTFLYDRPFHRGEKDPENESKTLCIERTKMRSVYKFPGILRWYEVIGWEVELLCPIRVAIETLKQYNTDFHTLSSRCQAHPKLYFKELEMRLQGIISAAVQGGTSKYYEAFFTREFEMKHPQETVHLLELKALLNEQVNIMSRGLKLHGKLVPADLQPLHDNLDKEFKTMQRTVKEHSLNNRGSGLSLKGFGSNQDITRSDTPSTASLTSTGSARSSLISQDEDMMVPPEELPAFSERSRRSYLPMSEDGFRPPVPCRPQSMLLSGHVSMQVTNQLYNGQPRTGSDPSLVGGRSPGTPVTSTSSTGNLLSKPKPVERNSTFSVARPPVEVPKRRPSAPAIPSYIGDNEQPPKIPVKRKPAANGSSSSIPELNHTHSSDIRSPRSNFPPGTSPQATPTSHHVPPLPPRKHSPNTPTSTPPLSQTTQRSISVPSDSPHQNTPTAMPRHSSVQGRSQTRYVRDSDAPPPIPRRSETQRVPEQPRMRCNTNEHSTDL